MTSFSFQAEQLAEQAHHFSYGDGADPVAGGALATEGLVYGVLAVAEQLRQLVAAQTPAVSPTVVYKAESEGMALDYYATRALARAHCVTDAERAGLTDLRWITDAYLDGEPEPDDLWGISGSSRESMELGFRVLPITIATAYDPDADDDYDRDEDGRAEQQWTPEEERDLEARMDAADEERWAAEDAAAPDAEG